MSYQDPIITKLIEKLNAEGPARLRNKYYIGDPMDVAESLLPICFISKGSTSIASHTTGEDAHSMPIALNVVGKFSKDLNQRAFVEAGTASLYELCEARNADYTLKSDSLAGVIRKYEVLDGNNKLYIDNGSETVIDYGISTRRGLFSVEAVIRVTLRNNQLNPGV